MSGPRPAQPGEPGEIVADAPAGAEFERGCIALDENGHMTYRGVRLSRAYRDKLVVRGTAGADRSPAGLARGLDALLTTVRQLVTDSPVFARLVKGHEYLLALTDPDTGEELAHREVGPIC